LHKAQYHIHALGRMYHFCQDPLISKRHEIDFTAVDAETAYFVADAMEGLAAGARVQLLCLLAQQGRSSVKDLTAATGMEQPAVSQHLKVLRDLGFVRAEKKGRQKIYELYDPHVAGLLEQVLAHAEHLRNQISTRADATEPLARDFEGLQRAG
jgi:DNA-binding transcriptional ArsR family regulator